VVAHLGSAAAARGRLAGARRRGGSDGRVGVRSGSKWRGRRGGPYPKLHGRGEATEAADVGEVLLYELWRCRAVAPAVLLLRCEVVQGRHDLLFLSVGLTGLGTASCGAAARGWFCGAARWEKKDGRSSGLHFIGKMGQAVTGEGDNGINLARGINRNQFPLRIQFPSLILF
jgi:hypothetical protein